MSLFVPLMIGGAAILGLVALSGGSDQKSASDGSKISDADKAALAKALLEYNTAMANKANQPVGKPVTKSGTGTASPTGTSHKGVSDDTDYVDTTGDGGNERDAGSTATGSPAAFYFQQGAQNGVNDARISIPGNIFTGNANPVGVTDRECVEAYHDGYLQGFKATFAF